MIPRKKYRVIYGRRDRRRCELFSSEKLALEAARALRKDLTKRPVSVERLVAFRPGCWHVERRLRVAP